MYGHAHEKNPTDPTHPPSHCPFPKPHQPPPADLSEILPTGQYHVYVVATQECPFANSSNAFEWMVCLDCGVGGQQPTLLPLPCTHQLATLTHARNLQRILQRHLGDDKYTPQGETYVNGLHLVVFALKSLDKYISGGVQTEPWMGGCFQG